MPDAVGYGASERRLRPGLRCNTHFAARHIQIREGQSWSGSGTLVSMASGLPYAVAASLAFPDRPAIAVVGDGGFAMLMAELSTAVFNKLDVKVMVLNNEAYGQVEAEQREIGNPIYGCGLGHIDFAKFAEAVGAKRVFRLDARRIEDDDASLARDAGRCSS